MGSINTVLWYDGKTVRPFDSSDKGEAFKWILVEKEGVLFLMAMPKETNLDFHKELRDRMCSVLKWDTNKLKVLGGGVKINGDILHKSTYFGKMPPEYRAEILALLGLN